jgi:chemotaxis protein CheZ
MRSANPSVRGILASHRITAASFTLTPRPHKPDAPIHARRSRDRPIAPDPFRSKPGEPNYDAIYAAVVGTAEGRWFLAQYASRNRNADTAQVLVAIERLECEVGRERSAPAAPPPPEPAPPGPDMARLRHDLGEFADALMRARADIAAIGPAAAPAERPSILAATEALQGLAWFMRERGMDPRWCDRIEGCAGDIRAVCAIPDLTAQRTRAIVDVLRA